jgi:hypothetical protein
MLWVEKLMARNLLRKRWTIAQIIIVVQLAPTLGHLNSRSASNSRFHRGAGRTVTVTTRCFPRVHLPPALSSPTAILPVSSLDRGVPLDRRKKRTKKCREESSAPPNRENREKQREKRARETLI